MVKKILKIGIVLIVGLSFAVKGYAGGAPQISSDPKLVSAYEAYGKGERDEVRGDKAFRVRPGKARRMYEHAEDYYLDAAFRYKELGIEHGINTRKEVDICNKSQRQVHVKINKARRKEKKR